MHRRPTGRNKAFAVGFVATIAMAMLAAVGAFEPLERTSVDLRYAHARLHDEPMSDEIRFVDIDDGSLELWGKWSTWDRSRLATVIDELRRAGARTIAMDLVFADEERPETDEALALAARDAGNVIVGIHVQTDDGGSSFVDPYPALAGAVAGVGSVSVDDRIDPDDAVRRMRSVVRAGRREVRTFALEAVAQHDPAALGRFLGTEGANSERDIFIDWPTTPTDWTGTLRRSPSDADNRGHVGIGDVLRLGEQRRRAEESGDDLELLTGTLATALGIEATGEALIDAVRDEVRFQMEALEGVDPDTLTEDERAEIGPFYRWYLLGSVDEGTRTLRSLLADKLVFIGWTATAQADVDVVRTPLGPNTPGVMVHASVADMVLSGRRRTHLDRAASVFLCVAMGLLVSFASSRAGAALSTGLFVVAAAGFVGAFGVLAFSEMRVVVPLVAPVLTSAVVWASAITFQAVRSQVERARITRQFKARVSPALVDMLIDNPDALSVDGAEREVTTLFLDLAGFTSISESLDGRTTVRVLNTFMKELTERLVAHGAYVNKFLGDGLMAFWSAFGEDEHQAQRACEAAIDCLEAVRELGRRPELGAVPALSARIGVATGRAVVGDCGAPPLLNDYTVIGDSVNLAARLESANKQFGTLALVDDATRRGAPDIRARMLGAIVVVGQQTPVRVHELLAGAPPEGLVESTREGVTLFETGSPEEARRHWASHLERFGDDRVASLYLDALERGGLGEPPRALVLREK